MEKLKSEKAIKMLRNKGVDISEEQAVQVLEILRKFAFIVVAQHFQSQKQKEMQKQNKKD